MGLSPILKFAGLVFNIVCYIPSNTLTLFSPTGCSVVPTTKVFSPGGDIGQLLVQFRPKSFFNFDTSKTELVQTVFCSLQDFLSLTVRGVGDEEHCFWLCGGHVLTLWSLLFGDRS